MAVRLFPRERRFFDDFVGMAEEIRRGASMLADMLAPEKPLRDKAVEIKEAEHRCDFITHGLFKQLNRTFVTPFEREDIYALVSALDNVMDAIDASAGFIRVYNIERVRPGARELARIIQLSADEVVAAMRGLERLRGVANHCIEIHRLENEADRIHQDAVERLFEDERDPKTVLKWKEVLDQLEQATDRCEDVADAIGSIVMKHA